MIEEIMMIGAPKYEYAFTNVREEGMNGLKEGYFVFIIPSTVLIIYIYYFFIYFYIYPGIRYYHRNIHMHTQKKLFGFLLIQTQIFDCNCTFPIDLAPNRIPFAVSNQWEKCNYNPNLV